MADANNDDVSCLVPGKLYVDGICTPGFTSVQHLRDIKTLHIDPSDVLVAGYPKSGMSLSASQTFHFCMIEIFCYYLLFYEYLLYCNTIIMQ